MSEKKEVLENKQGENLGENQSGKKGEVPKPKVEETEHFKKIKGDNEQLQKDLKQSEEDLRVAREDVSTYQGEADRAKAKLNKDEELDLREEELDTKAHNTYMANVKANYPEVYESYQDSFNGLKGNSESEYIDQARYLQQGIDKAKAGDKIPNNAGKENLQTKINNDQAPELPSSNQEGQEKHIFTRLELQEHQGDLKWFGENQVEIDKQAAEGLIK